MNKGDIRTLAFNARNDGTRLYGVSELVYKISIIGVWIVGIIGVITSIFAISQVGFFYGLITSICFFIICFILYVVAVLSTHVAKVLVHTSFASVAIIEHISQNSTNINFQGNAPNSLQAITPQSTSPEVSVINEETTNELGKDKFDNMRIQAVKKITNQGHTVSMSGDYPMNKWTVTYKNGQTKKLSNLDELIFESNK